VCVIGGREHSLTVQTPGEYLLVTTGNPSHLHPTHIHLHPSAILQLQNVESRKALRKLRLTAVNCFFRRNLDGPNLPSPKFPLQIAVFVGVLLC
jgi:FtsP/CotA-like multicopper oxidase with cupredoxin domain